MTDVRRKNFLAVEGRSLANGESHQLTAEEWLYLVVEVEDELVGPQTKIFANLATQIYRRHQKKFSMETVAL